MPTDKHVTVYVDLQNVEEVKSLMQDAATRIGALRAALEAIAALSLPALQFKAEVYRLVDEALLIDGSTAR